MSRTWKRILSLLVAFAMTASLLPTTGVAAAGKSNSSDAAITWEKVENGTVTNRFPRANANTVETTPEYADDQVVRASIVLEGKSTLEMGYTTSEIASNTNAMNYRAGLRAQQEALAAKISDEILDGAELDVVWNITLAANIISVNVEYGKIEAIKELLGVADVVIETRYEPAAGTQGDSPNMSTATEMTGSQLAWAAGYTGAGSRVAIVDTGLDTDHELFDAAAFDYAVDALAAEGKTVSLMTAADVEKVWNQLNIAERLSSSEGVYRTTKVPFGANYVDSDLDITHDNDSAGEHGSHVAGIAAANRFVTDDNGGFVASLDKVNTQGQAADAQLIIMKVFGKGGGAYDSDYMVAIEDAILMDADAVNLSLGSVSPGFTTNTTYADILDSFAKYDTVVTISAGNSYAWSTFSANGELYSDDVSYHTGGSPGVYANSLAVASVNNAGGGISYIPMTDGDDPIFFSETSDYGNEPIATIAGEHKFVFVDGIGTEEQFAAVADELAGAIALCYRGTTSFYVKANAAVANGAVGVIIVNNQAGTINMNLTGYEYTAPAVSITQADGARIKAIGEQKTAGGVTYYTGTLTIEASDEGTLQMSDFSSWGGNGALTMKPEITAPGGSIYSVNGSVAGGKGYEIMSGTSMAAPQVAGLSAIMAQYIRENGLEEKTGKNVRQLTQSLLMSTSEPILFPGTSNYYSLLKQGSGLANVNNAMNAKSYVWMDESASPSASDGKVKVELGEIARGESFTVAFTVNNFSDEELVYDLNADFFTQNIVNGIRKQTTTGLTAAVAWTVDGEAYTPADASKYDFNGDGAANGIDAQHLLNYCADNSITVYNAEYADLDGDGDIDTYDAYLAFQGLNGATIAVEAGKSVKITATVTVTLPESLDVKGNYVEGFIFVKEGDTEEGVVGVEHSIPVYGYIGNFTDASMYDRGSYLEYAYSIGDGAEDDYKTPYLSSALGTVNVEGFLISYAGESGKYFFGGNPFGVDEVYYPERNAINANDSIVGVQYTQIRNAAGSRFWVSTQTGGTVKGTEQLGGASTSAYYYVNGSTWRNTSASASVAYSAAGVKEGTKLNLNYQLAPEYYVTETGAIDWDALGEGALLTIPFVVDNTAPYIVDVYTEDDDPDTLLVMAHDNEYIALVALYTEDGTLLGYYGGQDVRRGEQLTYPFDLSENEEDHLLVEIYDYANNLSTYKINFNTEELENDPLELTLSADSLRILKNTTAKLTASATPWGMSDEVVWESADESIATVNESGIVTGVSVGTTTITATSVLDTTVTATCEVEVFTINMTVYGILQDAAGTPLFYGWNLETDDTWTALGQVEHDVTAVAYDWLNDDGQYFYQQDFNGYMYKIDIETLETVETSASTTGFGAPMEDIDFPFRYMSNSGNHRAFAVAENYLLYSADIMGNVFGNGWNISSYLSTYGGGGRPVAIAWGGSNASYDYLYTLDTAGYLFYWMTSATTGGLQRLGYIATDLALQYPYMDSTTGNSMIMGDDGEFYLAHFNGSTSELYQLAYDADSQIYKATRIGDVGEDVWPATILTVVENSSGDDTDSASGRTESFPNGFEHFNVVDLGEVEAVELIEVDGKIDETEAIEPVETEEETTIEETVEVEETETVETTVEETEDETEATEAEGGLNALPRFVSAEKPEAVSTDVTVFVTADELTTNGLLTVTWDPTTITLTGYETYSQYKAVVESEGSLIFAHVTQDGIEEGGNILMLRFDPSSNGVVSITTEDVNEDDDNTLVETVILGSQIDEHTEHEYEVAWSWTGDDEEGYTAAIAVFTCTVGGEAVTVEAEVTVETIEAACDEAGKVVYTATAEFEGETYTDTKEVAIPATGHVWGEPTWTWAEDYSLAAAKFVCENDETHVVDVVATDIEVDIDDETGEIVYTATVTGPDGETYTDEKREQKLYKITVDDRTGGKAETSIEEDAWYRGEVPFTVACDVACVVAVKNEDGTYTRLYCTVNEDGAYEFTVSVEADVEIVVVIKGDANLDGKISSKDAYLITNVASKAAELDEVQTLAADVNVDGKISSKDTYAVSNVASKAAAFEWDVETEN